MGVATLDHLEDCQKRLISALDGNDIDALETSIVSLHDAVQQVRAAGAWRDVPEVVERAKRIAALSEAAQIRVNFLTDFTSRRLQQLAAARGQVSASTYGRNGMHLV
jgi:hypothetical protein